MRKATLISALLFALVLLAATGAQANAPRVTQGDAQAIFQAALNGGWAVILNGETVEEGAPTDFLPDSMARISPAAGWNGRHLCSLDWHVISVAAVEGNAAGQSRTNEEIFDALSQRDADIKLDGALLDTTRTSARRTTNPENRGLVEAFDFQEGRIMAPEDLSVGQHSVQLIGNRTGQPPMVMPPVTFFIDAPGTGTCL